MLRSQSVLFKTETKYLFNVGNERELKHWTRESRLHQDTGSGCNDVLAMPQLVPRQQTTRCEKKVGVWLQA